MIVQMLIKSSELIGWLSNGDATTLIALITELLFNDTVSNRFFIQVGGGVFKSSFS